MIIDGTCDEIGRRCGWVLLDSHGPASLTLACDPFAIEQTVRPCRAPSQNPYPPQCLGSADPFASGSRRSRVGQRRRSRSVRAAGAVARDAEHAPRKRLAGGASPPPHARRGAHRALVQCRPRRGSLVRCRPRRGSVAYCCPASALSSSGSSTSVSTPSSASSTSSATRMSRPRIGAGGVSSAMAT